MHFCIIRPETAELKRTNRRVFDYLRKSGIDVNVHCIPLDTQPFNQNMDLGINDIAASNSRYSDCICSTSRFVQNESTQNKAGEAVKVATGK